MTTQLTVEQLIEELQKQPKDARIWAEGMDEVGNLNYAPVFRALYDKTDNTVVIAITD